MFDKKYGNLLTIILIIVIIAVIALLGFLGYDIYRKYYIDKEAEEGIEGFNNSRNTVNENTNNNVANNVTNNNIDNNVNVNDILNSLDNTLPGGSTNNNPNSSSSSNTYKYKEYEMIGYIEIPKTKIKYPILKDTSTKALETSVTYLNGPGLNQVGNSVIVGHNYRNGLFFSDNKKLSNGDKIYITDTNGTKLTYTIYDKYETTPEDASYFAKNTEGKKEVTLSTCTDDSKARTIICARAD